jgi:glycosyltransferase involved in cell wall biosynthesis
MRIAIVHYWLLNMRGGEKVVESLCRLLPEADLFTLFYDPNRVSRTIRSRVVHTSFLQPLRRQYRSLLPLMPMALENFDLSDYDLVISSESGPAKGVIVRSDARHVCYCHTPMRYLWELYPAHRKEWTRSFVKRALLTPLTHYLRLWDYASAARVDEFVANSENTRRRIHRSFRREAMVIHPPVEVDSFYWKPPSDYHLVVSELVPYKRIDAAIRVFSRSGRRLRIVGDGPEFKALKRIAAPNVEFCGRVGDQELRELYARCLALVMPGEEDFGIAAVEALASGKPVVALGKGGVTEAVPARDPVGGVLYADNSDAALRNAVDEMENVYDLIHPQALQSWALQFSEAEFARKMEALLFGSGAPVEPVAYRQPDLVSPNPPVREMILK